MAAPVLMGFGFCEGRDWPGSGPGDDGILTGCWGGLGGAEQESWLGLHWEK
jgi:hypothetical protein